MLLPEPVAKMSKITPVKRATNLKKSKRKQRKEASQFSAGRWTDSEHQAFLQGLATYGREWKRVAQHIPTRTSAQVRSHAQKYFTKLQQQDISHENSANETIMTPSMRANVERILAQPASVQQEVEETLQRLRQRYRQLQVQLQAQEETQSASNSTLESLQDSELIALHVLQGGMAQRDAESSTTGTVTSEKEKEHQDHPET
jgi:SHAQKYF class myb-like DNA-binding protein